LPSIAHPLSRPVFARTFRSADTIICTSRYTEGVLLKAVPEARSIVISNAVDAVDFAARVEAAQPFEKSGTVVLFVGAVKPRKGVLELIRAFDTVHRSKPDSHCMVIGSLSDTAYADILRTEIARLGLDKHVTLAGRVSDADLIRWYRTADIFALPAMNDGPRFEGFGLVYLEASAAGLPVIGTRDCGAQEAIIEGQTGLLVSQTDVVEELSTALNHLLDSPDLRVELGENGRIHAAGQTWERAAQTFIATYEDVLRNHRA
jgi:phosphatidylinositol alpha-1,6-mannosyltransferase